MGAQVHTLYGSAYVTLASIILTLVILIVSEIIPKTIGANYWRSLAPGVAYLVSVLIVALYPAVWFSEKLNRSAFKKKNRFHHP